MRETRSSGSVEGVISDGHSYSDTPPSCLRGLAVTSAGPGPAATAGPGTVGIFASEKCALPARGRRFCRDSLVPSLQTVQCSVHNVRT